MPANLLSSRKLFLKTTIFILFSILVINACRKIDQSADEPSKEKHESDFFTNHASNDPLVLAVMEFVKGENGKYHFTDNLIRKIGYPYWDKSIVTRPSGITNARLSTDTTSTVFIPFVLDSQNVVKTTLVVKVSPADTNFHFIADWQYKNQPYGLLQADTTAENVAFLFMLLDRNVFGYNEFRIRDTNLFASYNILQGPNGGTIRFPNNSGSQGKSSTVSLVYTVCIATSYFCSDPNSDCCVGGCDYLNCCVTFNPCYPIYTCTDYEIEDDPYPPDPPPPTSGGSPPSGGGGGGWTPPECPPGPEAKVSTLPGCPPGWYPPPIIISIPAPEPIDSMLNRYSRAIRDTAIFIYDNLSKPNNVEYAFTGTLINNSVSVIERRTNNDSLQVFPKVMIGNLVLLFTWHSHVSRYVDSTKRSTFSTSDIEMLRNVRCLKNNFVSFADCRFNRYALVITDSAKATAFFNNNSFDDINENYTTTGGGNTQAVDERCVKNAIGSNALNGIAFYVSNDPPNFQSWTLLNP